jgi:cytochrome c553
VGVAVTVSELPFAKCATAADGAVSTVFSLGRWLLVVVHLNYGRSRCLSILCLIFSWSGAWLAESERAEARDNPFSQQYMWGATATLGPQTAQDLAVYFSTLPPTPANDGDRALAEIGRDIFLEGIPEYNIASCAACHGPNAEGIGQIPRLGGLSYSYLKRRLAQWGEGYHVAAEPPMPRIASRLAPNEIAALASYLSFIQ